MKRLLPLNTPESVAAEAYSSLFYPVIMGHELGLRNNLLFIVEGKVRVMNTPKWSN